jgi:hypothetical protein
MEADADDICEEVKFETGKEDTRTFFAEIAKAEEDEY